ncbi:MAG: hypothetical protein CMB55_02405 [Euryarchaeota archaeon]|nr:hypothetical protein [Euryarchaeota archaeon]|tara:strand:- start:56 stop:601 length:546 start_codon:yes stop_codon:yes gene_type:complete
MDEIPHEVIFWISEELGEEPSDVLVWAQEAELVQLLIRMSDRVAILSLLNDEGEIIEEDSLIIRENQWQPNSIQTRRMKDGFVRFRHRSNEILLAPKVRGHETASGQLEGWLSEMRGEAGIPKTKAQRVSSLMRSRDRIERMLDQANLSDIRDETRYVELRLASADNKLAGKDLSYSSSEE